MFCSPSVLCAAILSCVRHLSRPFSVSCPPSVNACRRNGHGAGAGRHHLHRVVHGERGLPRQHRAHVGPHCLRARVPRLRPHQRAVRSYMQKLHREIFAAAIGAPTLACLRMWVYTSNHPCSKPISFSAPCCQVHVDDFHALCDSHGSFSAAHVRRLASDLPSRPYHQVMMLGWTGCFVKSSLHERLNALAVSSKTIQACSRHSFS